MRTFSNREVLIYATLISLFCIFVFIFIKNILLILTGIITFLYLTICCIIVKDRNNVYCKNGRYYKVVSDDYQPKQNVIDSKSINFILKIIITILVLCSIFLIFIIFSDLITQKYPSRIYSKSLIYLFLIVMINYLIGFIVSKIKSEFLNSLSYKIIHKINLFIIALISIFVTIIFVFFPVSITYKQTEYMKNDFNIFISAVTVITGIAVIIFYHFSKFQNRDEKFKEEIYSFIYKMDSFLKEINKFSKRTKLFDESFRLEKLLLKFSKNLSNRSVIEQDEEYFEIVQKRFFQLEEEFYNKNFDLRNITLYKESVYKDYEKKFI